MKNVLYIFCLFALNFCSASVDEAENLEVSIRNSMVTSDAGQQFVNVKCSGQWHLALVDDKTDVDWASLSVNSGVGNKSNVILSYQANLTDSPRRLKIVLDNGSKWVECEFSQASAGQQQEDDTQNDPDQTTGPTMAVR